MNESSNKFVMNLVGAVLVICITGLMTWLGWLTSVVFDHTKTLAEIAKDYSYIQGEVSRTRYSDK